jgi:hypothetical protein
MTIIILSPGPYFFGGCLDEPGFPAPGVIPGEQAAALVPALNTTTPAFSFEKNQSARLFDIFP